MELNGRRVVITGGAGLIGSHIADRLVRAQVGEVVILDNFVRGRRENLDWAQAHGPVTIVEGDIRDRDLLKKVLRKGDLLYHQAAIRITQCAAEPRAGLEVMFDGSFNLLEAAVDAGVERVVAASSASIYGMAETFPTPETHHPYDNDTLYGAGKLALEQMLRSFHAVSGLSSVALRYFNVYGPRMDIFGKYTEVMIRWLDCVDEQTPPLIFGDGSQTMDLIFVGDVADANILAMQSDVSDEVFNIGTGRETSLQGLLDCLLTLTGSELKPEHREERKVNPVPRRIASTEKAKRRLGFEAKVSLEEGLGQLIAWRREAKRTATAS